jgi:hypothetical protein
MLARALGLLTAAEGDQVEGPKRAGKAPPEVTVETGVLDDSAGDERMGDLQEDSGAAAEKRRYRGVPESPHHALRTEVAVSGS